MAFRFSFAHLLCTLTLTMFRCLYYRSSLEPRRLRPISHKPCPALSLWSEPHFLSPHRRRIGSVAAAETAKNDLRPGVAGRCRPVNEDAQARASASPSTGSVLPVARARLRRPQGRVMLFLALRFVCSAFWPNWTYQIRPPDGAGLIHRALRFQESRAVAAQDPDTGIWWLLPHQWRQCSTDASDVHFDDIPYGLVAGAAGRARNPPPAGERKLHKQGLRRRYYHGDGRRLRVRCHILKQDRNDAIGQVWRQCQAFGRYFVFTFIVSVANRDQTGGTVDRDIHWAFECRALLHQVIGQQAEMTALRKNRGFVL